MTDLLKKYKKHFQEINELYDYQKTVLKFLSYKNNTLSIIPTGGGKSLIYQLASLENEGATIVICPLIALMNEQVDELNKRGIPALALNSEISFDRQRKILRNLNNSEYKLIYLSPERLQNYLFRASLISSGCKISMIVIDEAHCVSQWGGSFRPEYNQIGEFVKYLNSNNINPYLFSLTATLAKEPRKDILRAFSIKKENVFIYENMIRENLNLTFKQVNKENEKEQELLDFIQKYNPQKIVAYLYSKPGSENYADQFRNLGYNTSYFHADLSKDQKELVYENFKNNRIQILFATTAFGLGINIPDIESVVQIHIPNSVEEYYQQVGRGWRDKNNLKTCNCLALWSDTNFDRRKKEVAKEKYTPPFIYRAYKKIIGSAKIKLKGQIVNKDKESLLYSKENLQLIRYKLESKGILETLGEINGSISTIKLKKNTPFWNKILELSNGIDSLSYVTKISDITIPQIIDHLYEQELNDNIKSVPASKRDIYFKVNEVELPEQIAKEIMDEVNAFVDLKLTQLDELQDVFSSTNPEKRISEILYS